MKTLFDKIINFWKTGKNGKPIIIVIAIILLSCLCCISILGWSSTLPEPISTSTATSTNTATVTLAPTITDMPTTTLTPTITNTPTITLMPTITNTPTITPTNVPTIDPLTMPHGDGFYLVNVDIAPGVWRSQGTGDNCYWAVTTKTGGIIDNHFGMAGGTAYISPSGFQVEFKRCGTWIYLGPP